MLRIVCFSDTHTWHDKITIPDGDILVHAGDFTNFGAIEDVRRFNAFLAKLAHPHKIVIAGNHDFSFERTPEIAEPLMTNCTYLRDQSIVIQGIRFYGSPWQPWFGDWAFNLHRGFAIRKKWNLIPDDTDILVTHGPPFGYGDVTFGGEQVGCMDLLRAIERVKPRYHIFGHIHEDAGVMRNQHTTFINASSCNLRCQPTNAPIVFDYHP